MTELEIAKLISTQKSSIAKLLKIGKDELSNLLDDGVHNYLSRQRVKFSKMKTFLFRNETVDFNEIYFPLKIWASNYMVSNNLFDTLKKEKFITVIGKAGSGKSMLMIKVFIEAIEKKYKIPIIVELRNLKSYENSLFKYINDFILGQKIKSNTDIFERALDEGKFIFLFDGYDEVDNENLRHINTELDNFIDKHEKNDFVITTRPGTGAESFYRFNNWYVEQLSEEDIVMFVKQQTKIMKEVDLGDKIISEVFKEKNSQYLDFLSNPLLLSMFIFTFKFNPELPKTKSKFYWNVFDTLCTKHDSITKGGGYLHKKKTGLGIEDIETILMWFSYMSFFEANFSFDEKYFQDKITLVRRQLGLKFDTKSLLYDLKVNISILVQDGLELHFPHRSIQEYFGALLISKQQGETKEKIYTKRLKEATNNNISIHNFLTLCYELDKISFLRFFLIPQLNHFITEVNEKSEANRIRSFFSFMGFYAMWRSEKRSKRDISFELIDNELLINNISKFGVSRMFYSSQGETFFQIFNFLDLYDEVHEIFSLEMMKVYFRGIRYDKSLYSLTKTKEALSLDIIFSSGLNDSIINYFEENNVLNLVSSFVDKVIGKYTYFEKELKRNSVNSSNLLGI